MKDRSTWQYRADAASGKDKVFLFLQGPHGPFFRGLGKMLGLSGATVWRVGFNAGDQAFWPGDESYIPYTDLPENWAPRFRGLIAEKAVTDIVLYGDVRGRSMPRRFRSPRRPGCGCMSSRKAICAPTG